MAFDIYQMVTDKIVAIMEQGIIPWHKDWSCGSSTDLAISYTTRKPYSLLNQMLLEDAGEYITFNECKKLGGSVKKGSKSKFVVFWKWIDKTDENGQVVMGDDGKPEQIPFLRYYNVFHINDCEGIKSKLDTKEISTHETEPIEAAEKVLNEYLKRSGVKLLNEKQNQAFYRPSTDSITLPLMEQFETAEGYYATAFHEAVHSTGHETRLKRIVKTAAFGSESYSKEELVAEIGSAYICSSIGIDTDKTIKNSAAYLQNWLTALKNDKKLIVSASGQAAKAADMILDK